MNPFKLCPACSMPFLNSACPSCTGDTRVLHDPPAADPSARTFAGLEIVEEIGRGGMGVVYKARQLSLGRIVALKLLPAGRIAQALGEERFEQEARALASISHPSLVTVHEFARAEGLPYIVMEFVEGTHLGRLIDEGSLSPAQAIEIAIQVCQGLQAVHSAGIVHRDIKPANILLDGEGRVKLADFGLAKMVDSVDSRIEETQTGIAMGTQEYMSPEQRLDSKNVDVRTDLYSLGLVLRQMLSGRSPELPSEVRARFPGVVPLLDRALQQDRSERYSSALEMAQDLKRLLREEPSRRKRTILAVAVLLSAGVAMVAGVWWRPWVRRTPPPQEKPDELQLKRMLSEAAAIRTSEWTPVPGGDSPSPESLSQHPITYVLLRQIPPLDFERRTSSPSDITKAMEWEGKYSLLQPEYLRSVTFQAGEKTGSGRCEFVSSAYRGALEFSAAKTDRGWEIREFRCPLGGETSTKSAEGRWRLSDPKRETTLRAVSGLRPIRTLTVPAVPVTAIAVDERWIAAGDADGNLRGWEGPSGIERLAGKTGTSIVGVRLKNGRLYSANARGEFSLWDLGTGGETRLEADRNLRLDAVAMWIPQGLQAFFTLGKKVKWLDLSQSNPVREEHSFDFEIYSVAMGAGGTWIAGGGTDGKLRIWDCGASWAMRSWSAHTGTVECLAAAEDAGLLVSGGRDGLVRLWSVAGGQLLRSIRAFAGPVYVVALGARGKVVAAQGAAGVVKILDASTGEELRSLEGTGRGTAGLAIRADGSLVAAGQSSTITVWESRP